MSFNRPFWSGDEMDLIARAVQSAHISGGGRFTRLAEELLEAVLPGSRVLLMTSCTHALEAAALLAEVGPGSEVVLPTFSFVSVGNAFLMHGARLRLVDSTPETMNLDVQQCLDALGPKTRAVCAIHYGGVGADPHLLEAELSPRGITFIEDNAHGLGGSIDDRPLGTFGDLATLSFHETKNITCGEGGALVVNRDDLVERAFVLRDKGTDRRRFLSGLVDKYTWTDVGSSWTPSDLLAAILVAQLPHVDSVNSERRAIWSTYAGSLTRWAEMNGVILPALPSGAEHTGHVFWMLMPTEASRDRAISTLRREGVQAVFHYVPLHLSSMGRRLGYQPGDFPVAENQAARLLRLPIYPSMTASDVQRVISAVSALRPRQGSL